MIAAFENRKCKPTHSKRDAALSEINRIRKKAGLKKIVHKDIPCMTCKKSFTSEGPWNRMCWFCSDKAEGSDI